MIIFDTIWRNHLNSHLCHGITSLKAHFLSFFDHVLNWSNSTKGVFWKVVMLSFENFLEATNGFGNWNIRARKACKLFCNIKVLRQEELDTTRTPYQCLFFF